MPSSLTRFKHLRMRWLHPLRGLCNKKHHRLLRLRISHHQQLLLNHLARHSSHYCFNTFVLIHKHGYVSVPNALVITSYAPPGLGMFIFLTFIVRVIVTPSLALVFVASMYSLFWLPQIVRSVKRGRSSALTAEYLIGTSLCRLFHALCEY